ncbi:MAG: MarR family transcriptional regulator [Sedimentisphaerales bacterium]|nr:MarR family transcriptional regulator [Sedimentisphaerales bacterium]
MQKGITPDKVNNETIDEFFETVGLRVLKALRRIIRAVDIHSRKLNTDFQITSPQLICLYSLVKEGAMTQSELAKQVSMGISTINGIIDRLEKKNLVVRERDTKDRRKVFVDVTKTGKELTKSAPSLLQEKFSNALRDLPKLEQAAIAFSLERVVELMEAEHLEASPNLVPDSQINDQQKV